MQSIVVEVFCARCCLADDAVITGINAFGQGYLHFLSVQEGLDVVHLWCTINACHTATLETLQEDVQYGHLLRIVLVFFFQNHHLLVLVYTLDETFESYAGTVAWIVAIRVAGTEFAEATICQRMLVPVNP